TRQGCKRDVGGGSVNLRCKKVNSHGLADPARLQEARARWLGELAVQESKLARVSRPGKVTRGTSEVARRTCGAGKKVISYGLADPARLQEARARWLANLQCKKLNSHGLAHSAMLQEARASWLGELALQESNLARVSRLGKVAGGTSELARRTCGAGTKVISYGLADPARLQEARARWLANLQCKKLNSHGLAHSAMLQEARASWLGEHAVQKSKLAQVSRPGNVGRGTSVVAR
ncbi:hypothetical protein CRG98_043957, partial [Punica granatum]